MRGVSPSEGVVTATLLESHGGAEAYHADWRDLLDVVRERGGCDALIVDAPYSERTHDANDGSAGRDPRSMRDPGKINRALNYTCWTSDDARNFVEAWSPLVRGWFLSITDHHLAPVWAQAMDAAGRYSFSPLACVQSGSRIRLLGDGPSQWSTWAVASRPRDGAWISSWRSSRGARGAVVSLPGAYVVPPGESDRSPVVGGKASWLMRALVRDYSEPGDLVVDPCMGAGTTLLAARLEGRRAIGGDAMREHAELAAERIRELPTADKRGTLSLFARAGGT